MLSFSKDDLYVYELSEAVLQSLKLMAFDRTLREVEPVEATETNTLEIKNEPIKNVVADSLKCQICGTSFEDLQHNRDHRKTDLHTFNVKRSIRNLSPVSEDAFEVMLKEHNVETSGYESDEDGDKSTGDSAGSDSEDLYREISTSLDDVLENEISKLPVDTEQDSTVSHLNTRSAQIYFNSSLLPNLEAFGIYKALFSESQLAVPYQSLKQWNDSSDHSTSVSALFMLGGGHFAGAIVSHQRINVKGNAKKADQSLQEQAVCFLEHKTFHRYTTRRKQGGSQSAMDQAKGKANSAGSSLRRYNETALRMDIEALLEEWGPYLSKCENIFLRAHNNNERKMFTENKIIKPKKEVVKSFPFTTGRPTVTELKRSWCELTYLKKVDKPQPIPVKKTDTPSRGVDASRAGGKEEEPKVQRSNEEVHTEQLLQYLKKAKAPLLVAYLRKHNIDVNFRLAPHLKYTATPTMLHVASQQGLKQMVTILLSNMKCDPCIMNGAGKTAWDLAKDIKVKRAFQLARYKLGENGTDWDKSHIAEPLSREQIEELDREETERKNEEAQAAIKHELGLVKERQRAELEARRGPGKVLEGQGVSLSPNLNSLSEEQRKRLMREQRARAAEARMQKR